MMSNANLDLIEQMAYERMLERDFTRPLSLDTFYPIQVLCMAIPQLPVEIIMIIWDILNTEFLYWEVVEDERLEEDVERARNRRIEDEEIALQRLDEDDVLEEQRREEDEEIAEERRVADAQMYSK